jgi:probable DNA repair protein
VPILSGSALQAVREGAIILTANQRLSRTLRKAYDDLQATAGRAAWASPAILPFSTWLRARWSDALLAGAVPAAPLLSPSQEEAVWRRIIASTPEGASLLDLRGAARSAMQAWRLMHQYRLPFDGRFQAHEDWSAFASWAARYRQFSAGENWLDEARLPDVVRQALDAGSIERPAQVLLAGFDEFTPQQQHLLESMKWAAIETEAARPDIARCGCPDAASEIESAAAWSRERLEAGGRVGVVVLALGVGRTALERIFDQALHPERMSDPAAAGPRSFHISIPAPLADYPLIGAALLALRLAAQNRWALADAGLLLRSPFFAGGVEEAPARAAMDATLRRRRRAYVSTEAMEALWSRGRQQDDGGTGSPAQAESLPHRTCPALTRILAAWRGLPTAWRDARLPSGWTAAFREALTAAGWPGNRVLSSAEYQVFEAWDRLLHDFASLDAPAGNMASGEAIARLAELAADAQFQPQDPGAPVQIMGALEAAGAQFDALWIAGATDETWPAPSHPHPFLPLSMQREHRLPHSSPEREYEFAAGAFARLRSSAQRIVVSWARRAGDVDLRPSPLIAGLPEIPPPVSARGARSPLTLEQIVDETAPPLETTQPRGGTRVIERQSACPFQAFAYLRLNAQPLDSAELGLSAAGRGIAIHEALRLFWEAVRDHATLVAMDEASLRGTALQAVTAALGRPFRDSQHEFDRKFRELETTRLTQILLDWAELEKTRAPFRVAFSERERTIPIAGLELAARVDRVDELPDGRQVILDYKATAPSVAAWFGDRPGEPQLPLYAISNEAPVAALAFAQVGPDGLRFKGYATADGILPGVRSFPESARKQIEEWRRVLEPLARSFLEGAAQVDPRNGGATCELCRLTPLCRIHEIAAVTEEADADA